MFLNNPLHKHYYTFWIPAWFVLFVVAFFIGGLVSWDYYSYKSDDALQAIVDNLQTLPSYGKYLNPDSEYIQKGQLGLIINKHNVNLDPYRKKEYNSIKIKTKNYQGRDLIVGIR